MFSATFVIVNANLYRSVHVSMAKSPKTDNCIAPNRTEIIFYRFGTEHTIPGGSHTIAILTRLELKEGVRLSQEPLSILEFYAFQFKPHRSIFFKFSYTSKDHSTSFNRFPFCIAICTQERTNIKQNTAHRYILTLPNFVVEANRNMHGSAQLIVEHKDFCPVWVQCVFDRFCLAQNGRGRIHMGHNSEWIGCSPPNTCGIL
mmetsp:Transcript_6833/g.12267  ORF Transcript_6833/g.12267 Transcript_6833/m.12267 type:complete len:202 (-) Transcript_6833:128-733(-)